MEKIRLRALTMSDIEKTFHWHNQDEIRELYLGHPFPVNIEMEKKWYEKYLYANFPVTVFGVEIVESQELIGLTVLRNIHMINREAEFAAYIGETAHRGKGFSTRAAVMTLDFGFCHLGLNRIYTRIMLENTSSVRFHKSAFFKEEGILRQSVYKKNRFHDQVVMGILKSEFDDLKETGKIVVA